ncbi:MAG: hypothetical protein HLX50_11910 [Alteromonadaceae bacterium]|nr:hypothetical protein [Alteromonadaceae bacterium]
MKLWKRAVLAVSCIVAIALVLSRFANADVYQLRLGDDTFCIPSQYSLLDQTVAPARDIAGSDSRRSAGSFQVSIPAEEVEASLPVYQTTHGKLPAILVVRLEAIDSDTIAWRMQGERYADVLHLMGEFSNATVQTIDNTDLFRVSDYPGPPFPIWKVLNRRPEAGAGVPSEWKEFLIAHCSRAGGYKGASSNCEYSEAIDGYWATMITTENNLSLKAQITRFMEQKLQQWRDLCE